MGKLSIPLLRFGSREIPVNIGMQPEADAPFNQGALLQALGASGAGIWEWDVQTNRTVWSEAIWPLYGLDRLRDPPCFDSWLASIHPDDRAHVAAQVVRAADKGEPFEVEWRTKDAPTSTRWLMARGHPDQADGRLRYIGIVLDISERKQAEQGLKELNATLEQRIEERTHAYQDSKRKLQHILDGIPGLVGYWDCGLCNQFANHAYGEWFGAHPRDIKGRHLKDLLGPDLFESNRVYIEAALRGEPQRFERELTTPAGDKRASEAHYLPDLQDGEVRGFPVMVFDVSHVKQAERAAASAKLAKSEFLANISHELRTPLNAIFGLAQLGIKGHEGEAVADTFTQILESGQHLMTLINDVLDYSKIESGKMPIQFAELDLGELVEQVVAQHAEHAEAKGLVMLLTESPNLPMRFVGDTVRCSQILGNLLSNAIKFTEQGLVQLDLDCDDTQLHFTVRDTGIGIPSEAAERLFQPFEPSRKARVQDEGSTGLGLAISLRLARLMAGSIQFSSTPGEGSSFTLSLPFTPQADADWRPLAGLCIIATPDHPHAPLQHALLAREARIRVSKHIPEPSDRPSALLLTAAQLPWLDTQNLRRLLDLGTRLLIGLPAAVAPRLEPYLANHAILINGPLSPLRILHALGRAPAKAIESSTERLRGMRVLAAEDNPINRLVLGEMLAHEGAEVTFACDGVQALELVKAQGEQAFEVVLCDIQMPLMDGYQTTRALAEIAPSLPVIGLTAHAFMSARQEAVQAGMVAYVTKPYMLDTLVSQIRQHARPRHRPSTPAPALIAPGVQ
jgi:PAS domain S-box-containing protein